MPRYFESYVPDAQLVEISAVEAADRDYYVVEHKAPPRYEHYSFGVMDRVIYSDQRNVEGALKDLRQRYGAINARVYSPYVRDENGAQFSVWYVADGLVTFRRDYQYQADSRDYSLRKFNPDGELETVTEYVHEEDWGLAEILTYDADGELISRQRCDPE